MSFRDNSKQVPESYYSYSLQKNDSYINNGNNNKDKLMTRRKLAT